MQVKTFVGSPIQCDNQINEFIKENNLKIVNMFSNEIKDYYYDGNICNQGHETTIVYEEMGGLKCLK